MDQEGSPATRRAARTGLRRLALALAASLGAFGLAEVLVRVAVFGESQTVRRYAWRLRRPQLYCDPWGDEEFWKLQHLFGTQREPLAESLYHPSLGWVSPAFEAATLRHRDFTGSDGRRQILLFGDSFARCATPREDCFEALLAQSENGASHALLNYGVSGYGLDQVYLLLSQSLDLYAGLDPIVVVGVFVNDDLDRCLLSLRDWPKPRLRAVGGALVPDPGPVPSMERYLADHPLRARSYAWSALVRGTGLLSPARPAGPASRESRRSEIEELGRAILDAFLHELQARQLQACFLLFYSEACLRLPERSDWRDALIQDHLEGRGFPYVSTRRAILEDAASTGRDVGAYYGRDLAAAGHLNRLGNEVTLRALLRLY